MQADNEAGDKDYCAGNDIGLCAVPTQNHSFNFNQGSFGRCFLGLNFNFRKGFGGGQDLGVNRFGVQQNNVRVQVSGEGGDDGREGFGGDYDFAGVGGFDTFDYVVFCRGGME